MARNPELARLDQAAAAVRERRAALLAISGDNPFVYTGFAKKHGFAFPLLRDVHRPVSRAYGVLDEERNARSARTDIALPARRRRLGSRLQPVSRASVQDHSRLTAVPGWGRIGAARTPTRPPRARRS